MKPKYIKFDKCIDCDARDEIIKMCCELDSFGNWMLKTSLHVNGTSQLNIMSYNKHVKSLNARLREVGQYYEYPEYADRYVGEEKE